MHELSIALCIVEKIVDESEVRGGVKITAVHLKIGALAGVDSDALSFSYGVACEGTPLEGSRLVIEKVPVLMRCPDCGRERMPESLQYLCCPECQTSTPQLVQGRELEVTAFEVAT
jgi:hydrogenase nickel incorporation protein HypA/HybF